MGLSFTSILTVRSSSDISGASLREPNLVEISFFYIAKQCFSQMEIGNFLKKGAQACTEVYVL